MSERTVEHRARAGTYPLSWLGDELSAVINRVRRAFGPIPMAGIAVRPEVEQAEQAIEQAAGQLRRGEIDLEAWRQALNQYENTWMLLLVEQRRAGEKRCAA